MRQAFDEAKSDVTKGCVWNLVFEDGGSQHVVVASVEAGRVHTWHVG